MSPRDVLWLVVLCFCLLSWSTVYGDPSAYELVRDSLDAPYFWDCSGTQVIVIWTASGASVSTTVSVNHRKSGATLVRELNGTGRIVLEEGTTVRRYDPRTRTLLVDQRPPAVRPSTQFRLLARSHKMILSGTDKVCGRKTYVVLIVPRVPGNPWRKCWIDYYTKYPLKNEQYGPDWPKGEPQSFMFWSSISFKPVEEKSTRLILPAGTRVVTRPEGQLVASLEQAQKALGFRIMLPTNPPPGYIYDGATLVQTKNMRAIHLRFTNGLNAISLFQSRDPIPPAAVSAGSNQAIVWRQQGINVALVGNLSKSELETLQKQIGTRAERDSLQDVVKLTGANLDEVKRLRDRGYGYRNIAIALLAAKSTHQDPTHLLRLYSFGFTWEELALRYSFDFSSIRRKLENLSD